jgi:hypothetical protein
VCKSLSTQDKMLMKQASKKSLEQTVLLTFDLDRSDSADAYCVRRNRETIVTVYPS